MFRVALLLCFPAFLFPACGQSDADQTNGVHDGSVSSAHESLAEPRPRRLRPPPPFNKTPPPLLLSATEVVIGYKGASHSKAARTKEEAREKAQEILDRALKREPLPRLASRFSDSPSARNGGYVGVFEPDSKHPGVAKALLSVGFNEVVPHVVETPFGFHVLRREKVAHVGHVLVMHNEARMAHNEITRTKEEASAEAERLHKLLAAEDADFAAIATKNSDCRRTKLIGGDMGYYGKSAIGYRGGRLMPELIKAVARLRPGQVSEIVESDYGFHVAWLYPEALQTQEPEEATQAEGEPNTVAPDAGPGKTTR